MDAAIPVYKSSFVTVCTVVDEKQKEQIFLVDPTAKEEANSFCSYVGCEIDGSFEIISSSEYSNPSRPPFKLDSCCDKVSNVLKQSVETLISKYY